MTGIVWWSVVGLAMAALSPSALRWQTRRGADAGMLLMAWAVLVCCYAMWPVNNASEC